MSPETVLDIFLDQMDQRHWSTSVASINGARQATLQIVARWEEEVRR